AQCDRHFTDIPLSWLSEDAPVVYDPKNFSHEVPTFSVRINFLADSQPSYECFALKKYLRANQKITLFHFANGKKARIILDPYCGRQNGGVTREYQRWTSRMKDFGKTVFAGRLVESVDLTYAVINFAGLWETAKGYLHEDFGKK